MRRLTVMVVAVTLLALTGLAVSAPAATTNCGSRSLGPGSLIRGDSRGASCLLHAFGQHCHPASYRLSVFGVDTVAVREFGVVHRDGRCEVEVTSSFHVVPRSPHTTGHGFCRTLARRGSNIVAAGCTGAGLAAGVSLTSAR